MSYTLPELIERWNSGDGKPYKGSLIDWDAFKADSENIGCMCAQGQALHLLGGWSPTQLRDTAQEDADRETAKLLGTSSLTWPPRPPMLNPAFHMTAKSFHIKSCDEYGGGSGVICKPALNKELCRSGGCAGGGRPMTYRPHLILLNSDAIMGGSR